MNGRIISVVFITLIVALFIGAFVFQDAVINKFSTPQPIWHSGNIEIKWNENGLNEENLENVAKASTIFGLELLQNLSEKNGNILLSPLSIWLAMAMLYEGANSTTAEEIAKVMHFPENKSLLRENINYFLKKFGNCSENFTLSIANSLWTQNGFPVRNEYVNILKNYYYAYFKLLNFIKDPEKARIIINSWVENKTMGKIKDFFPKDSITKSTVAVLVNALYFHGLWANPFNESETNKGDFHTPNGIVEVDMMHQLNSFRYAEDKDAQIVELPYNGTNLSMLVILPRGNTLNISLENLNKWRENLEMKRVEITFPKFKIDVKFSLKESLEAMGIREVFTGRADLSLISPQGGIFASNVYHETYVSVDERGTEAAAATGISVEYSIPPPPVEFRVDHPFLFLIQDRSTGAIFFMGWVEELT